MIVRCWALCVKSALSVGHELFGFLRRDNTIAHMEATSVQRAHFCRADPPLLKFELQKVAIERVSSLQLTQLPSGYQAFQFPVVGCSTWTGLEPLHKGSCGF
jgi:hypothetical protein